jgi:hypothetical protein
MFNITEFSLTNEELERIKEWDNTHECTIKRKHNMDRYVGAIGGRLSITFIPTSIGTFITVKCCCGEELDVADGSEF